jgi:hypothetical protein
MFSTHCQAVVLRKVSHQPHQVRQVRQVRHQRCVQAGRAARPRLIRDRQAHPARLAHLLLVARLAHHHLVRPT